MRRLAGPLAVVLALVAGPLAAAELAGNLRLVQAGRALPGAEEAVVWVEPAGHAPRAPHSDTVYEVVTERKDFQPHVLVVPVGSKVRFPNRDPILHNVFSVSGDNSFDLGLYGKGSGEVVTFEEPGVVRVFCNVHHSMVAHVVVLGTPFYGQPDRRGSFALSGLPAGKAKVHVWHERAETQVREVTLPLAEPLALELELTKPRVPRHLNKLGKPYGRSTRYR